MDIEVTDLPQPLSPTIGEGLAGADMEGEALDGADDAVRRAEMGLEVLNLEEGVDAAAPRALSRWRERVG